MKSYITVHSVRPGGEFELSLLRLSWNIHNDCQVKNIMVHYTQFTKTPYSIRPPRKWLNIDFTNEHVWVADIGCLHQTKWEGSPWNTGMSVLACGHRWITNASAALSGASAFESGTGVWGVWDHVHYSRNVSGNGLCFPTESIPADMLLPRLPVMWCFKGKEEAWKLINWYRQMFYWLIFIYSLEWIIYLQPGAV